MQERKILITGFAPFGGEEMNPAYEAVKRLPEEVAGVKLIKEELPVVFRKSGERLIERIRQERPEAVLCIGQAGGRAAITIEKVAINLIEARIADNEGNKPEDEPIREEGPAAYFATVPVKAMVKAIREAGVPAHISYTAGTYVCNSTLYQLLDFCAEHFPEIRGGFIHLPYATEQVLEKNVTTPSMGLDTMVRGLTAAISAICV